jgi:glycosyltransferase involved in cell wall biosynthesis
MSQEKVLLISCYFPPAGGIQVQRALSLARYLPENGFEVFVLTARASVPNNDPELTKLIPECVHVHRTWTLEPPFGLRKKLWARVNSGSGEGKATTGVVAKGKALIARKVKQLLCPDPQVLWYPFAMRRASKLIRDNGIQTVIVTAPPFSAFLLVNALKRRFPYIHTIADVRDEWLQYFVKEFAFRDNSDLAVRAAEIERATVESCDRIVAVTEASLREVRSRYPDQPGDKFVLIPNGYDPASFSDFKSRPHKTDKIVVTYAGTVYKPCSPKGYLEALDGLPDLCQRFETRFVGRIAEEFDRGVFNNRKSLVRLLGFSPQKEVISLMEETDVLLLPWVDRFNIPGKLFEYLATGKPILALCYPGSDVERVIQRTSSGWCVNPEDSGEIKRVLNEMHAAAGNYPEPRNWEAIRRYERPALVVEYAKNIRECSVFRGNRNLIPSTADRLCREPLTIA